MRSAQPKFSDTLKHPQPRSKRKRGNLSFELLAPTARNFRVALRARSIFGDVVLLNHVAISLDEQFMTVRTIRVLEVANSSRQITGIDEPQSCLTSNLSRTLQRRCRRVFRIGHLVVLMERRHVPRNI